MMITWNNGRHARYAQVAGVWFSIVRRARSYDLQVNGFLRGRFDTLRAAKAAADTRAELLTSQRARTVAPLQLPFRGQQ